ncbi:MAG: hypothetical protein U0175_23315 [Caldilineaceae bacterium]
MKKKASLLLVLALMLGLQSACINPSIPSNQPTPENVCPTESAEMRLLTNIEDGYCLLYPAEDAVVPPRFIVIHPANASADTLGDAWVELSVEAVTGRSAAQVAALQIAAAGKGFNIIQREILVDGRQQRWITLRNWRSFTKA